MSGLCGQPAFDGKRWVCAPLTTRFGAQGSTDASRILRAVDRGRVIGGKYELLAPIGEGGMGVVWKARHVELGREVALKRVIGERASELTLQRFLREAQSAAAVRAPNVVDVVDYGRDEGGDPYLVMELLGGESLEARLRREPPMALDDALDLLDQALVGLTAIHDAEIVHRDLKPANLFLARASESSPIVVKVLDFGIARPAAPDASALTHTMQTLGTPHYMSAEQVRSAKTVDARTDVYSMGVILYQVVTGRLPFEGPSATAIIAAIVTEDPPPIRSLRPEVPATVAEVIQRAMSRRADDRFADARALREALSAARRGITLPGMDSPRVSVNAPTAVMTSSPGTPSSPGTSPLASSVSTERATAPKERTGRRGFFALFGMLGTAAAAGLAFLATQRTAMDSMAEAPTAPSIAAAAPAATTGARGGVGEGGGGGGPGSLAAAIADQPPPPAPQAAVMEPTVTTLIGEPMPLAALALRWRALPPTDRMGLVLRPLGDGWVLATASTGHAQRIAAVLGGLETRVEDAPAAPDALLVPRLFRTNARTNVRRGPTQESGLIATVTSDALLTGLIGRVDDQATGAEETSGWVRVYASSGLDGWVARRLLEEDSRCAPAADDFDAAETLSRASVHMGSRGLDVFMGVDRAGVVHVYETDSQCTLTLLHTVRTRGAIADAFFTEVSNHGESVLVLGEWPSGRIAADGRQRWTARLLSEPDSVIWALDLASGQNLPDARREGLGGPFSRGPSGVEGFFPLRIRRPHDRTWLVWSAEQTTFIEAAADASTIGASDD